MRFLALLMCTLLAACSGDSGMEEQNPDSIPTKAGYRLVWNDEFNGAALDNLAWHHEVTGNPFNNELQYYTNRSENSFLQDGSLHLVARDDPFTGADGTRDYTSARITTQGGVSWQYGRFEVRARMPVGRGIWPAIWMMPENSSYGGWPRSGEIDIMEYLGHDRSTVYGTLHYAASAGGHRSSGDSHSIAPATFSDDYHEFALEWDPAEIRWYVDGVLTQRQSQWQTEGSPFPAPFDKPFFMILNVAVGGDWPGSPNANTTFPQTMSVDYVRVFELVD